MRFRPVFDEYTLTPCAIQVEGDVNTTLAWHLG